MAQAFMVGQLRPRRCAGADGFLRNRYSQPCGKRRDPVNNMASISKAVREATISEGLLGTSKARVAVHIMVILILLMPACSTPPNQSTAPNKSTPPNDVSPPALAAPGKTWHVAFSEDFNGNDYDHNKLTPCFDWNYANGCTYTFNQGREKYMPEQVRVSDGTAKLVAEPL